MQMQVMTPGQLKTRHNRRPTFPTIGGLRPYQLVPFFCHPVLPGETLQHGQFKHFVRSRSVENPYCGAWLEMWLVYVKLTDLDRDLGQMFVTDDHPTTGYSAAADKPEYFVRSGQIDWIGKCVERVHDAYFSDEGESARLLSGLPQVKMNNSSWYQNLTFQDADQPVNTADTHDHAEQMRGWQMLQQMRMDELSYESYLKQYGVQSINTALGQPEVLRYSRNWTLPRSEIDTGTGAPIASWLWHDDFTVDKPKRFDEPGFLVCMGSVRPKLYVDGLAGSRVGSLWGFTDWFPAYNLHDPTAAVRSMQHREAFDASTGATDTAVLYDHRDLLSHGEQFDNGRHPYRVPVSTGMQFNGSSTQDIRGEYCTASDVGALFKEPGSDTDFEIGYEGLASLRIAGHIVDTTPNS